MYRATNQKCNFFITSTIISWIEGPLAAHLVQINKLANANISWYGSDAGVEIGYFSENPFAIVNGEKQWAIKYNAVISGGIGSFVYGYKYKNLGPSTVNKTAFFVLRDC